MENNIQYPKPKIILIDLDKETELRLKSDGFNITTGSLGTPYKVIKKDDYDFIYSDDSDLPNLREQEIVIIDLEKKTILDHIPNRKLTRDLDKDIRVRLTDGIVDPRPLNIFIVKTDFETIWKHGGIFIIFSEPKIRQEYVLSQKTQYDWFNKEKLNINLWSFFNFLNENTLGIESSHGNEFKFPSESNKWSTLLSKYISDAQYTTTFFPNYLFKENIKPILLNKYNEIVGALIFTNDKSTLIILPQIGRKLDLINELLKGLLPESFPDLFPYYEGKVWLNSSLYDIELVAKIKKDREKIIAEKNNLVSKLDQIILETKNKFSFLYKILTDTGHELVEAIEEALKLLELKNVTNIDKEISEKDIGQPKQEDLQILDKSPSILSEVKGITGLPREDDIFQIVKYLSRRMKEWKRTDIRGLVIVNHQKNLPPLRRDKNPFTQQQIKDSLHNDFALVSTWNLFLLIKGMLKYNWNKEFIKLKLYESGLIDNIPLHYLSIGQIENYWEHHDVVGLRLEKTSIKKGDIISFVTDNDYLEQKIDSLQVENIDRNEATDGELAGIKTVFSKEILKKKLKVYKVNY